MICCGDDGNRSSLAEVLCEVFLVEEENETPCCSLIPSRKLGIGLQLAWGSLFSPRSCRVSSLFHYVEPQQTAAAAAAAAVPVAIYRRVRTRYLYSRYRSNKNVWRGFSYEYVGVCFFLVSLTFDASTSSIYNGLLRCHIGIYIYIYTRNGVIFFQATPSCNIPKYVKTCEV